MMILFFSFILSLLQVVVATLSVVVVVVSALAAPDVGYGYDTPSGRGSDASSGPAQYNFQWDVDDQPSGNFYGHQEQRDGDRTDGRLVVGGHAITSLPARKAKEYKGKGKKIPSFSFQFLQLNKTT